MRYDKNNSIAKILEDLVRQYDKYNNIEEILFKQAKASAAGKLISEEEQYVSWYKIITTIVEDTRKDKIIRPNKNYFSSTMWAKEREDTTLYI